MTNEEKDKKEYEVAVLLRSEDHLPAVMALVSQHHVEGVSEPRAKRLQLAYEINKVREAVFVYFTFKAYGDDIKALEGDLNSQNDVLRHLIIASPAPAERPAASAMAQGRRSASPSSANTPAESRTSAQRPLSNEALEKKIEEILQ